MSEKLPVYKIDREVEVITSDEFSAYKTLNEDRAAVFAGELKHLQDRVSAIEVTEPEEPQPVLVVTSSGDFWEEDPQYEIFADNVSFGVVDVIADHDNESDPWQENQFDIPPETKVLTIRFLNDGWGGSPDKDRNLYIQKIIFNGVEHLPTEATLTHHNGRKLSPNEKMQYSGDMTFTFVTSEPEEPEEPEDPVDPEPTDPEAITTHPLTNTSGSIQTNQPYRFGQGFVEGDIPAGHRLVIELADGTIVPHQVDDRVYHLDGSLKYGVISCIVPSAPTGKFSLKIKREVGAWVNSNNRDLSDILNDPKYDIHIPLRNMVAHGKLVDVGIGSWNARLQEAIKFGRVKCVGSGQVVKSFEVDLPLTGDTPLQLHATNQQRWYLHLWELPELPVEYVTQIQQEKMFTKCDKLTYTAQLFQGDTLIKDYGEVLQNHHGGWFAVDDDGKSRWAGIPKPPLETHINKEYWCKTELIPNFDPAVVMDPADDPEPLTYKPGSRHNLRHAFDGTGGDPQIGLVTGWFARAFVSAGAPGYMRTSRINALSYTHLPCTWRDDATGEIPNLLNVTSGPEGDWSVLGTPRPNTRWPSGYNKPQGTDLPGHNRDCGPEFLDQFDDTHFPSLPYWHYLIEGGRHWLNMVQQSANYMILQWRYREQEISGKKYHGILLYQSQMRGVAWSLREIFLAAAISPTECAEVDDPVIAIGKYFKAVENNNAEFGLARAKLFEDAGLGELGLFNDTNTNNYTLSSWMQDFFIAACAMGYFAGKNPKLRDLANYLGRWRIGLLTRPEDICPYWSTAYKHGIRAHYGSDDWVSSFKKVMVNGNYIQFKEDNKLYYRGGDWEFNYFTENTEVQFSFRRDLPPEFSYSKNYFLRNIDPATKTVQVSEVPDGPIVTFQPSSIMPKLNYHPDPSICPAKIQADYEYGYAAAARMAVAMLIRCGAPKAQEAFDVIESIRDKSRYNWGSNQGAHAPNYAIVPYEN